MFIDGYAFKSTADETIAKYKARCQEIRHLIPFVEMSKTPCYGHVKFSGKLTTPEAAELTELDIALIADGGNLCFGGKCEKRGNTFTGCYYTD